jgi:hypothetical protein
MAVRIRKSPHINRLEIYTPFNREFVEAIKTIGGAQWDKISRYWSVPMNREDKVRMLISRFYPNSQLIDEVQRERLPDFREPEWPDDDDGDEKDFLKEALHEPWAPENLLPKPAQKDLGYNLEDVFKLSDEELETLLGIVDTEIKLVKPHDKQTTDYYNRNVELYLEIEREMRKRACLKEEGEEADEDHDYIDA